MEREAKKNVRNRRTPLAQTPERCNIPALCLSNRLGSASLACLFAQLPSGPVRPQALLGWRGTSPTPPEKQWPARKFISRALTEAAKESPELTKMVGMELASYRSLITTSLFL